MALILLKLIEALVIGAGNVHEKAAALHCFGSTKVFVGIVQRLEKTLWFFELQTDIGEAIRHFCASPSGCSASGSREPVELTENEGELRTFSSSKPLSIPAWLLHRLTQFR